MTIEMTCGCGRRADVADEHAGKRARCPACGIVSAVPGPSAAGTTNFVRPGSPPTDRPAPPPVVSPIAAPTAPRPPTVQDVRVVDVQIPFESMIYLVFKWTMATIPTILFLGFIAWFLHMIIAAAQK